MRLEPGEQVMVRTRTHPRALLRPAAVLVSVAFLLGLAVGVLARPDLPGIVAANRAVLEAAAWVVAALALLPGAVRPLWRWVFRRTVVTDRRILQRAGVGGSGAAMPLVSIADVQRRRRGSGAGDLHILFQEPARQVHWRLRDVPEAARFEEALAHLTRQARTRTWPAPVPTGDLR